MPGDERLPRRRELRTQRAHPWRHRDERLSRPRGRRRNRRDARMGCRRAPAHGASRLRTAAVRPVSALTRKTPPRPGSARRVRPLRRNGSASPANERPGRPSRPDLASRSTGPGNTHHWPFGKILFITQNGEGGRGGPVVLRTISWGAAEVRTERLRPSYDDGGVRGMDPVRGQASIAVTPGSSPKRASDSCLLPATYDVAHRQVQTVQGLGSGSLP